ncbi:MAG: toxin, RelE family [Phycisphaerales bacterium]|jgi:plasmid stabilization system protein ParE|nr:toxin, RelE family [Phycisphaerales bacterium]
MSYRLAIRPEAEEEMHEAFDWYEQRRKGLGDDFLQSVEDGLIAIQLRPESFPIVHMHVRRTLIRRFPFGIYFTIESGVIEIIAVYHGKRDPHGWHRRVR